MNGTMKILDLLPEHAIAMRGDWSPPAEDLEPLSIEVYSKSWVPVDTIEFNNQVFTIARYHTLPHYILGYEIDIPSPTKTKPNNFKKKFSIALSISLSVVKNLQFKDKGRALGYDNLHNVNEIVVRDTLRGRGLAALIYRWLIHNGILLLGDRIQYFGARKLWSSLSQSLDVIVDLVDYQECVVLERNVQLVHGHYDEEFDPRVWSYDTDLEHIRLVLRGC